MKVANTKIMCLIKTVKRTTTVVETRPAVTTTVVQTVTVVPPPPTPTDFSGNGELIEAPFTTTVGETLSWTWQNTNGDAPTGMTIDDQTLGQFLVDSDGQTTSGSTYLAPGTHTLQIITIGNWTIHIG